MIQMAPQSHKGSIWAAITILFAGLFLPSAAIRAGTPNYANPKQVYTYAVMVQDMKELVKAYSDIMSYRSIGKSEYGRDLWELRVGRGPVKVMLNGVTLQQKEAAAFPKKDRAALLLMNKGSPNFKRWKTNAKGIDLKSWTEIRSGEERLWVASARVRPAL